MDGRKQGLLVVYGTSCIRCGTMRCDAVEQEIDEPFFSFGYVYIYIYIILPCARYILIFLLPACRMSCRVVSRHRQSPLAAKGRYGTSTLLARYWQNATGVAFFFLCAVFAGGWAYHNLHPYLKRVSTEVYCEGMTTWVLLLFVAFLVALFEYPT